MWDKDFPGFGVRLRVGRNRISRKWVYQYDIAGHTRRKTLGNVNAIGIEDARKIAGQLQGKVRLGDDPVREIAEKREREADTFASVLKNFLKVARRTTRASTWEGNIISGSPASRCIRCRSPPSHAATSPTYSLRSPPAASTSASNNVRDKLVTFFNWAIKQGLIENNPVIGTEKQEAEARERVLSMPELVAIWHALATTSPSRRHGPATP